jgi:hypothetical protein
MRRTRSPASTIRSIEGGEDRDKVQRKLAWCGADTWLAEKPLGAPCIFTPRRRFFQGTLLSLTSLKAVFQAQFGKQFPVISSDGFGPHGHESRTSLAVWTFGLGADSIRRILFRIVQQLDILPP